MNEKTIPQFEKLEDKRVALSTAVMIAAFEINSKILEFRREQIEEYYSTMSEGRLEVSLKLEHPDQPISDNS